MISAADFVSRFRAMVTGGVGPGLPRREQDKQILLKAVALGIATVLPCSERKLGEALQRWLSMAGPRVDIDAVSLRRALVDFGFLARDTAGQAYSRSEPRGVAFAPEIEMLVPEEICMPDQTLKDKAVDFLGLIIAGDIRAAYERYVGDGFRHHNPYFAGDAASLRRGMEEDEAKFPGKQLHIQAALQDGNHVAVHSRLRHSAGEPDIAVVHIFRFEQGRIAELWDIAQVAPGQMVNENGMF